MMTTTGKRNTFTRICAAAALLAAGGVMAADVTGTIVTKDDKKFTGVIKWRNAARAYAVSSGQLDLEFKEDSIKELSIPEPAGYAAALKAIQEGRQGQAIPVLDRIAQDYAMLQWDEPATRSLAEAYLLDGKQAEALRVCEKVITAKPEAAYTGEVAPLYWQALLKADRKTKVESLLEQAIKTGNDAAAANALIMRGDMLFNAGDFRGALKDGYLRVVTLFQAVKAAQPEALFKAGKAFDQLGSQGPRAESMRKQLVENYGGSVWAQKIKSGK